MLRALLIDDEPPACEDLRRLLSAHPGITVVGEAGSIAGARVRLAQGDYDLVFLDVQLVGGCGFDLTPHVSPAARIIFVTAYDQHALRAFEVNALDYLLKPVRRDRLAAALRRAAATPDTLAPPSAVALRLDDVVHVKTGRASARFVRLADIVQIESSDNYSTLHLADGTRLLVRETLGSWEARLPASHFMRVHRQTVVNLSRVQGFAGHDERTTLLHLAGLAAPVRARREHWPEISQRLLTLGRPVG